MTGMENTIRAGAPTKLRTGRGTPDVNGWNGSNNVPMRGNKGNLLEGGIRVPMFAYWKGTIPSGQVIDEMVTTLDFTATTLAAGGGDLPPEFDGVNILPRLTGKASAITRTQPMFWDFYESQAVRMGDWKLFRNASGDRLFKIADDPSELANVIHQYPEQAAQLAKELDNWVSTLRPDSTAALKWDDSHWSYALSGAPTGVKPDPRYLVPYDNPKPTPYPTRITGRPVPNRKTSDGAAQVSQSGADDTKPKRTLPVRDFGRLFKRLDTNDDGFVTLQEFIGVRKEKALSLTRQFKKRDANKDSRLTLEEIKR